MTNSKNLFDTYLEGQRKMTDWWIDASRKMMDTVADQKEESQGAPGFMQELFEKQQKLLEDTYQLRSPQEILEKAPEQYRKWIDLQFDFFNKWNQNYKEEAKKMGFSVPEMNGFQTNWGTLNKQMAESQQWLKKNIMEKLPEAMRPHYLNFTDIYEGIQKRWSAFEQMIQLGIYDQKMIERFFAPDQYKEMINKLMGFQLPATAHESLEKMNQWFDSYLSFLEQYSPSYEKWENYWKMHSDHWAAMDQTSFFQTAIDINQRMKNSMEPLLQMTATPQMGRYVQLVKDIQFAYTAFLLRTNELQSHLYQAGQNALPETIKSFYKEFKAAEAMPSFENFFNRFVDHLEKDLMKVLDSKEYSQLQAEVSKMGVTVKGKLDELVELSFEQTPVMMKSSGDELAKELFDLRRKVRELEKKVTASDKKKTTRKSKAAE